MHNFHLMPLQISLCPKQAVVLAIGARHARRGQQHEHQEQQEPGGEDRRENEEEGEERYGRINGERG